MTFLEIKQGMNKLFIQKFRKKMNTKKLKYKDFSFISVNCLGGVISHDLGLKFLSPTINLFFEPEDYIKFVENLQYYLKLELEEDTAQESYPVGKLGDIRIFFLHYASFDEAKRKWGERCKRINWRRIVCIFTDQGECGKDLVERFSRLPYNKLMFVSTTEYLEYNFAVLLDPKKIKTANGRTSVDDSMLFRGLTGKRNYEVCFDIITWLNNIGELDGN